MAKKTDLSRRSFLTRVVGSAGALGAMATVAGCASAGPGTPGWTGQTDNDGGPNQDRRGFGRGRNTYSGLTDTDSGYYQDAAGNGRGTAPRRQVPTPQRPTQEELNRIHCTDRDSNASTGRSDPTGYGRCRRGGS